ncbi:olfactory receptor 2D2-like [Bufo gargarizans]|uniref:olfactory receptor 2D2-like n=1 Tax=Bufo gargarizans TaxID=30331 RepID=UPI001CF35C14|nr:olfactory receptor 2D2-like [Bufo gargarizans]
MERGNYSQVTEFILLGFSTDPTVQVLLFQIFLILYMSTVAGNLLLIVAVRHDHRLHKSMYIFLANLSFLDICLTSITIPNMLSNFLREKKSISYSGCLIQVHGFLFLGETECVLLAFMAYDRYVAISNPLRYSVIMKTVTCIRMIEASWLTGGIISSVDIYFIYQLEYCEFTTIDHFFCEAPSLMELSCSEHLVLSVIKLVGGSILLLVPLTCILYSYTHIILAVLKIRSRRYKALSTCMSHLIIVIFFYGLAIIIYMTPERSGHLSDKLLAVFYSSVTPMLNPIIYSLRNKDVQGAIQHLWRSADLFKPHNIFSL